MEKIFIVLATLALCACNGTIPTLTFQQQVSIVCSNADAAISIASDDGLFTGAAAQTLTDDVQPDINKVCADGAVVTATNLQGIVNDAAPALKAIVSASTLSSQAKADVNTAIDLLNLAVKDAIALAPVSTAAATPAASQ